VHCKINFASFIRLNSKDCCRKPGEPAAVHFVFNLLAHQTPAKMSCEIDLHEPRESQCRVEFNAIDSTGGKRESEQT
jgi:hypothetical protein